MDPRLQPVLVDQPKVVEGQVAADVQHRVLRNTYWLLALSMLPTIAGAWTGMQFNFVKLFVAAPVMTPLLMFAVMIGALFAVTALRNMVPLRFTAHLASV